MEFKPIHDRIIIEKVQVEQKTQSGIIIAHTEERESDCEYGLVVAAGPGKAYDGTGVIPTVVKKGDIVLFRPNAALKHDYMGKKYYILREVEIASIVEGASISDLPEYTSEHFKEGPKQLESLL